MPEPASCVHGIPSGATSVPGDTFSPFRGGDLNTRSVAEVFQLNIVGGAAPEDSKDASSRLPTFLCLATYPDRYNCVSFTKYPGNSQYDFWDSWTRRALQVNYRDDQWDTEVPSETDAIRLLHEHIDKMALCNSLTITQGQVDVSCNEHFWVKVLDRLSFQKRSSVPLDIPTIRVDELAITGALNSRVFVVGRWASIFRSIIVDPHVITCAHEIRTLLLLKGHPHVAPCTTIVVDEQDNVRGFMTPFYSRGDLGAQTVFSSRYVGQLMMTTDDLNFRYGLFHNDLYPRNIMIDPMTDGIRIIDFELVCGRHLKGLPSASCATDPDAPNIADGEAACVVAAAYEMYTGASSSDGDDSSLLDPETRIELYRQRGDRALGRTWPDKQKSDVGAEETKGVLSAWRTMRGMSGYSWAQFVEHITRTYPSSGWSESLQDTLLAQKRELLANETK